MFVLVMDTEISCSFKSKRHRDTQILDIWIVGICVQQLTDAFFEFEDEKAAWALLRSNHDAECQRLDKEITKLINQLDQVGYPDAFHISDAWGICYNALEADFGFSVMLTCS